MRLLLNESVWVMLGESGNHKLKSYPAYQGCSPRPAEKQAASSSLGSVDLRIFLPGFSPLPRPALPRTSLEHNFCSPPFM